MISIKAFKKTYKQTEIKHPDMMIKDKVTLLIGDNGSGKTTLLKAIASLMDYDGDIQHDKDTMYAEEMIVYPTDMKVLEYLKTLCDLGKCRQNHMMTLVNRFELQDKLMTPFKHLSKGMKQKINLIQILMEDKTLYLLDEPFSGLDKNAREQLVSLIDERKEMFICATHAVKEFERLNPRKIYL